MRLCFLLAAVLTTNSYIYGQLQFTTHIITADAFGPTEVYATDLDGDGDVDVLSAAFGGNRIAWYENDGEETFTPHVITNDVQWAADVYATDVDGDGDTDVLSGSFYKV
ncbi:MAG: FG-GAP-like repeat-containing protein, partial [Ignavibacteriaceae bacterium]